jgi:hypothetical protein
MGFLLIPKGIRRGGLRDQRSEINIEEVETGALVKTRLICNVYYVARNFL